MINATHDNSAGVTAVISLAHISLMELLVMLRVLNVKLCYTRAKQQWDYVTGVISAR